MKKKKSYKQIINNSFNFIYAGVCNVFITINKSKYVVVCSGFTFDNINFFFAKNRYCRFSFDNLYDAIQRFNRVVNALTLTMDWYKPDFFSSEDFLQVVNDNVY